MSLTSYRAAPPRVGIVSYALCRVCAFGYCCVEVPGGRSPSLPPDLIRWWVVASVVDPGGCPGIDPLWVWMGWKTWRRPTLPCLRTQYHGRWGFSRPSSGWDRVRAPRDDHQVVQPVQWSGVSGQTADPDGLGDGGFWCLFPDCLTRRFVLCAASLITDHWG